MMHSNFSTRTALRGILGRQRVLALVGAGVVSLGTIQSAQAVDVYWIVGDTNNVAGTYGTDVAPLSLLDTSKWFLDNAPKWDSSVAAGGQSSPLGALPADGDTLIFNNSCCNPEPYVSIDNGGAGFSLPASEIRFINVKTNIFDLSAGDLSDLNNGSYDFNAVDDALTANSIRFDGGGGQAHDVYVPVIADTISSQRHGARFNAPITVTNILANSGHQDKWEINVSPAAKIDFIDLDENRGADGGSVDGFFAFNADTEVGMIEFTWSRLRVGAGATVDVDEMTYWDYTTQVADNNVTPMTLDGDLNVATMNWYDVASDTTTALAAGTYGAIGTAATVDNEVAWITAGDGVLTVGGGSVLGDFDGDGDVDGVDVATMFTNFNGPGGGVPTNPDTDLDNDGDCDGVDVANLFGLFTGPLAPATVPEPTSLALLGLGGLLVARRRRG